MNVDEFQDHALALGEALRRRGERLAAAESCTGGLFAAACTSVAGSSDWFERGFVTYSNEAKTELLDVDPALVATRGAVSEEVVRAMAAGALARSRAQWSVAVTGIAGPGGGSAAKPVGTVWLALGHAGTQGPRVVSAERLQLPGDRSAVRRQTVARAFERLQQALSQERPC